MEKKREENLEERLAHLKMAKQRFEGNDQISRPKIQRVPTVLRQNDKFAVYCTPKMISFGPIHHGNENLKQGEHYKLLWTSIYVEEYSKQTDHQDANQAATLLHKRIGDNLEELKKLFTEDAIESHTDKDLAWMLFVDGCSLLYFMENVDRQHPEALKLKLDQMIYMRRDILLLENQLPVRLLELLGKEGPDLLYLISNFNFKGRPKRDGEVIVPLENAKPIHILDFARSVYLSPLVLRDRNSNKDHDDLESGENVENQQDRDKHNQMALSDELGVWQTYKNIRDLKAAGIRVKANEKDDPRSWIWSNISFTSRWLSGELRLPKFVFNDATLYFFRNLIAYEMCPDFDNNYECCSFFSFMDSLIDSAEDVKELRIAGVIQNLLGSDEELAKLFNELGNDLPTKMVNFRSSDAVAYSKKYILVKHQIEMHYKDKWKTWLAEAYNTHCNTPWAMLAFFAALLALVLTFIQTWCSVHPKNA